MLSRIERQDGGHVLTGPSVWDELRLGDDVRAKLIRAGTVSVEDFFLRTVEPEQKRLLSEFLGVTIATVDAWRTELLRRYPELGDAQPCELGPLAFGAEFVPDPVVAPATDEYLTDFLRMVRGYDWQRDGTPAIDLREGLHPVTSQGTRGFCWAYAVVAAAEGTSETFAGRTGRKGSEAFVVQAAKADIGDPWPDKDGGSPAIAAKVLERFGLPLENDYPMRPDLSIREKPPASVYSKAKENRFAPVLFVISEFGKDINAIAAILNGASGFRGRPLPISVPLFQSFRTVGRNGIVPNPLPGETRLGYHAMTIVGLLMVDVGGTRIPYLIVRNSWGPGWGDGGYCFLSQDYLEQHAYSLLTLFTAEEAASATLSPAATSSREIGSGGPVKFVSDLLKIAALLVLGLGAALWALGNWSEDAVSPAYAVHPPPAPEIPAGTHTKAEPPHRSERPAEVHRRSPLPDGHDRTARPSAHAKSDAEDATWQAIDHELERLGHIVTVLLDEGP